jgi:predicted nuclease of restriction endonuclease-like (RecB) superfamily
MLSAKTEPSESLSGIDLIKPHFKDLYIFEFLNLPDSFTENELQKGLIQKLKTFLLELGKDFVIHEGICKFCAERNKRNCQ